MAAFENTFYRIRQFASTASKKTGAAVELSRLKLQAMQVNSMIQSTYERIGTLIYEQEKTQTDNSDLTAVCIREIDALLTELSELNDRIADLKKGVRCPSCSTPNPFDSTYCRSCGVNLTKKAARQ
jgi:ribosomal protein L40E